MGNKVLPYKIPSTMLTYPYNAFYLGIIEANGLDFENILIKDFTQIYYYIQDGIHRIDFTKSGAIECGRFIYHELPQNEDVISNIKKHIDLGYYAVVFLNHHYIKNENVYTKFEFSHDWLIYGYDDENNTFFLSSYIGNSEQIFGTIELDYYEVREAFLRVPQQILRKAPSYFRNHYIKMNPEWKEKNPTKEEVIMNIKKIFHPQIHKKEGSYYFYVGKFAIKKLLKKLKKIYFKKKTDNRIFLQNIRLMYDYRKNILLCLKYIDVDCDTIKDFEKIVNDTYTCLLIALNYNITRKKNYLESVFDLLTILEEKEKSILKMVLGKNR